MMNELREKLLDRMVKLYSLEDEIVIDFARLCETMGDSKYNDKCLELLVDCHESEPVK